MTNTIAPPKWIAWEITGQCNLHCIHCRSSSDMETVLDEFNTAEAKGHLDEMAEY